SCGAHIASWCLVSFLFFFQAEDGIRDFHVTGVQTCALPIFRRWPGRHGWRDGRSHLPGEPADGRRPDHRGVRGGCDRRHGLHHEIGRASCRERVEISVVAVALRRKRARYRWTVTQSWGDVAT